MRVGTIALVVGSLFLPALAAAQTYTSSSQSVIRPTGYGWRNSVVVPDGPCGCSMSVRADCYTEHCRPCCFRPLCFLKRVGRMLDCLLPCHRCGNCCDPCHGCTLGGHWGGCDACCGGPWGSGCGCGSYDSGLPGLSDPIPADATPDAPGPPTPMPTTPTSRPGAEVRFNPMMRPMVRTTTSIAIPPAYAEPMQTQGQRSSPWKVTNGAADSASGAAEARTARPRTSPTATASKPALKPSEQSVLRRTSYEEEIAPAPPRRIEVTGAVPIIRSQSPADDREDFEIPRNPLRR
jgi:hypothetical protein